MAVLEHDGESAVRSSASRSLRGWLALLLSRTSSRIVPCHSQYLTHHYLIDLVAGGSLACAYFYYYLARMPDELRHPTDPTPIFTNSIPLDAEAFGMGGGGGDGDMDWGIAREADGLMRDNSVDFDGRSGYPGLGGKQ